MYYAMVLNDGETFTGLVGCKLAEVAERSHHYEEEDHIMDLRSRDQVTVDGEVVARTLFSFHEVPRGSALIVAVVSGEIEMRAFERLYAERGWERAVVVPGPITGD